MSKTFVCARCGQIHPVMERTAFDGQELCRKCCVFHTCTCDHCGNRIWAEDSCGDENHSLCRDCEARCYKRCTDCGRLVKIGNLCFLPEDDTEGYCIACYTYRLRHRN